MKEALEAAIKKLAEKICKDTTAIEDQQLAQAALNLANALAVSEGRNE